MKPDWPLLGVLAVALVSVGVCLAMGWQGPPPCAP
jgi:hypothetical protein